MKIWQSNIYPTLTSFSVLPFLQSSLHGKLFFFSPDVLKRWSVPKICDGLWSFLCYWDIWYFFFPKIWSYPLRRKWNLIFLKEKKKYTEIWYFLQMFRKDGICKMVCAGAWSFLYYLERWYFFAKTWYFFLGRKARGDHFQGIHGSMKFSVDTYGCYKRGAVPLCQKK